MILAAPQGFEPRYAAPEAAVLPLNEGATRAKYATHPAPCWTKPRQGAGLKTNLFIIRGFSSSVKPETETSIPPDRIGTDHKPLSLPMRIRPLAIPCPIPARFLSALKLLTHFSAPNATSVKSGLRVESTLNFAWALLAAGMLILWLRHTRNNDASRWTQFAALAMLILILFPVISVTDDLLALQNPAETESYLRRDHAAVSPHFIVPVLAALPPSVFSGIFPGVLGLVAPSLRPAPAVDNPAMAAIQNRPPPVA